MTLLIAITAAVTVTSGIAVLLGRIDAESFRRRLGDPTWSSIWLPLLIVLPVLIPSAAAVTIPGGPTPILDGGAALLMAGPLWASIALLLVSRISNPSATSLARPDVAAGGSAALMLAVLALSDGFDVVTGQLIFAVLTTLLWWNHANQRATNRQSHGMENPRFSLALMMSLGGAVVLWLTALTTFRPAGPGRIGQPDAIEIPVPVAVAGIAISVGAAIIVGRRCEWRQAGRIALWTLGIGVAGGLAARSLSHLLPRLIELVRGRVSHIDPQILRATGTFGTEALIAVLMTGGIVAGLHRKRVARTILLALGGFAIFWRINYMS